MVSLPRVSGVASMENTFSVTERKGMYDEETVTSRSERESRKNEWLTIDVDHFLALPTPQLALSKALQSTEKEWS